MATNLDWIKCNNYNWCKLLTVNLDHEHFTNMDGVYTIWHGGENAATVRIGQGVIRDRLGEHRTDNDILAFQNLYLLVTWASVKPSLRDGVERFLAERLKPKVG